MVRKLLMGFALLCCVAVANAQENQVNRLPEINTKNLQKNYSSSETGFWIAAEAVGGYSCRLYNSNFALAEIDVTAGYRFSEYIRVGAGFGGRYYFDNDKVRYNSSEWAFPIYVNARGNFIPTNYRTTVPYWSCDLGGTILDGFMLRPTVGLRIGQPRSAFLIGLTYTGQSLKGFTWNERGTRDSHTKFVSFISLKLGYEF